ncbi:MAG: hypothetical protein O6909_10280 [Alphaproteobacteria bacterium]|nr:hypothetical protein [Alphaproteobacteria bacterium]
MRFILVIVILLVVVVAGAGGYLALQGRRLILSEEPVSLPAIEQALADDSLLGLAYLDIAAVSRLDRLLIGERDAAALPDPLVDPYSVVSRLNAKGIALSQIVDVLIVGGLRGKEGPEVAGVALGRFDPAQMASILRQTYLVESDDGLLVMRHRSTATCETSRPFAVHITPERVVFGSLAAATKLLTRLERGAPAAVDLEAWTSYRKDKLAAASTLVPVAEIIAGLTTGQPLAAMVLTRAEQELQSLQVVSAGVILEMVPPSVTLEGHIESKNTAWIDKIEAAYRDGAAKLASGAGKDLPSLTQLASALTVTSQNQRLTGRLKIDEGTVETFKQLPQEALRLMFSGFGAETAPEPGAAPKERLLDPGQLVRYRPSHSVDELGVFDQEGHSFFQADTTSGPIGVRIKSVSLLEDDPDVIEYVLEVEGGPIPNLPEDFHHKVKGRGAGEIRVNAVRDANGRNLLREETCGPDRNDEPAILNSDKSFSYNAGRTTTTLNLKGEKSVRLATGVTLSEVASIEGTVRLRMATTTETIRIVVPSTGQVYADHGLRVQFKESKPGEISYNLSGETDRLLALRALNGSGQYLNGGGVASSSGFGSPGRSVSRDFQGHIATVELVVAKAVDAREFAFRIDGALPATKDLFLSDFHRVSVGTTTAFRERHGQRRLASKCSQGRKVFDLAPYQICFREVVSYFGNIKRVSLDLRVPQDPVIRDNLSAVELRIDQLETGDGTVVEFPVGGFETFSNPTDEHSFSQSFFLDGDVPEGFDASSVTALTGRVRLRIPTAIETLSLDATILGSSAEVGSTKVRLTGYRDGVAQIEIDGPRERLVQILATKAEDKPVAAIVQRIEQIEETGLWQADLLLGDKPTEFIVRVATEQDIIETPFRINLEP